MKNSQKYWLVTAAIVVALASTAVASSYFTRHTIEESKPVAEAKPAPTKPVHHQQAAATKPLPPCDDHNVVGTVGGAVVGGLVGSQFGKGSGKGLATAGGAVAGGALGNAYIPTRGATCQ